MAAQIVIIDRTTKKTVVHDHQRLLEDGLDESSISFDPKTHRKYYAAYVHKRSKINHAIRKQRRKKCKSLQEAQRVEKRLISVVAELIAKEEAKGSFWENIIDLWEFEAKQYLYETGVCRNPLTGKVIKLKTVNNSINMLKIWTRDWLKTPASQLRRIHGKAVIQVAEKNLESYGSVKRLKNTINSVYHFGIAEEVIKGVRKSPVEGVGIEKEKKDTIPEILTVDEVRTLLFEARKQRHPWYPIWAVALATGMRSSELYALRKANVHLEEGYIRISESWDWETDEAKSTKAGYWRTAPIAKSLKPIVEELMKSNDGSFLFPRLPIWETGEQAKVLRTFCGEIGITSVRFHTLRACFATHLLASGVEPAKVMLIGGWKRFRTFERYVRLSGVQEIGVTDEMVGAMFKTNQEVFGHIAETYNAVA